MKVIAEEICQRLGLRTRNIAMLLLAMAFVFSQTVSQQHIHVDGEITANCVICHQADSSPGLLANGMVNVPVTFSATIPSIAIAYVQFARRQHDHQSRAPPLTR